MSEQKEREGMRKRRVTLEDGRYLIYYTFDDAPAPESSGERASKAEPEPRAESEEERRV